MNREKIIAKLNTLYDQLEDETDEKRIKEIIKTIREVGEKLEKGDE